MSPPSSRPGFGSRTPQDASVGYVYDITLVPSTSDLTGTITIEGFGIDFAKVPVTVTLTNQVGTTKIDQWSRCNRPITTAQVIFLYDYIQKPVSAVSSARLLNY